MEKAIRLCQKDLLLRLLKGTKKSVLFHTSKVYNIQIQDNHVIFVFGNFLYTNPCKMYFSIVSTRAQCIFRNKV